MRDSLLGKSTGYNTGSLATKRQHLVSECSHETDTPAAVNEPEATTDECLTHLKGRDFV